jgi:hypothetical protein
MKRINISMILICLILFCFSTLIYSQDTIKYTKVKNEKRNSWSLGLNYGENGFGPYAGLYSSLGRTTDMVFSISISGVTDEREIERFDVFGNSVVVNKINRVFMIPLSAGIRKELFKDDIDGDFLPIFNIGVAPTLVLTNPYNESYFAAFGNTQTYFAFGGYAGFGVSFRQNKSMSMNVNFNYYYLPLIGDGVQSLQYNTINDVGGLQLSLGVIFLK